MSTFARNWCPASPEYAPIAKAEDILKHSNARIHYDQADSAFYSPLKDEIHLPSREQFLDESKFYATALHELGHWTGHESRLDRDIANKFGTPEYAEEELRAELFSMMIGDDFGIGHDPEQHVSYIESWIKVLEDDPKVLFRSASSAEKMCTFVKDLSLEKSVEEKIGQSIPSHGQENLEVKITEPQQIAEKIFINVPFKEKNEAKSLGAKWAVKEKSWYIPEGVKTDAFAKWFTTKNMEISPVMQFKAALNQAGLLVENPIMDGEFHRAPTVDDKPGKESGNYKAYLDGHPNGLIKNFKAGIDLKWKADGKYCAKEDIDRLMQENLVSRKLRNDEIQKRYEVKSEYFTELVSSFKLSTSHPYLTKKGHEGVLHLQDERGNIVLPLRDLEGKIWSLQRIYADGSKHLEKDAKLSGCFYPLNEFDPKRKTGIIEGYSTALSVQKAIKEDMNLVVCISSNNLMAVAKEVASIQKGSDITIFGDDDFLTEQKLREKYPDRKTGLNPGREKAIEAAKEIGGSVVFPDFTTKEKLMGLTDFNDLEIFRGNISSVLSNVKTQSLGVSQ